MKVVRRKPKKRLSVRAKTSMGRVLSFSSMSIQTTDKKRAIVAMMGGLVRIASRCISPSSR
jgi:hypothetical protein